MKNKRLQFIQKKYNQYSPSYFFWAPVTGSTGNFYTQTQNMAWLIKSSETRTHGDENAARES